MLRTALVTAITATALVGAGSAQSRGRDAARTGSLSCADGPETSGHDEGWSVSFEINVPRSAMLTLTTNNGGIAIEDFRGIAKFHARNGGLALRNVGGDLRGDTTNGGVTLDVSGDHWD